MVAFTKSLFLFATLASSVIANPFVSKRGYSQCESDLTDACNKVDTCSTDVTSLSLTASASICTTIDVDIQAIITQIDVCISDVTAIAAPWDAIDAAAIVTICGTLEVKLVALLTSLTAKAAIYLALDASLHVNLYADLLTLKAQVDVLFTDIKGCVPADQASVIVSLLASIDAEIALCLKAYISLNV